MFDLEKEAQKLSRIRQDCVSYLVRRLAMEPTVKVVFTGDEPVVPPFIETMEINSISLGGPTQPGDGYKLTENDLFIVCQGEILQGFQVSTDDLLELAIAVSNHFKRKSGWLPDQTNEIQPS
ncbi:MAG: hypothetical protein EOO39_00640 [Cytophagaceae bacterium]|nr:MAG: hypothetical protein EOO39_00640 [Cytophagaceae bacterium]